MQLPASRKEARAAGLTKYRPVKPCKRGHVGAVFDIKRGCLKCHGVQADKIHVARKLAGAWHETLTEGIKAARARPDFVKRVRVDYIEPTKLALLVGHVLTKPRRDDKAPSVLTVSQELGRLLEIPDAAEAQTAGAAVIGIAESVGFAAPLGTLGRVADRMPASLVTLSDEAEAQRPAIEADVAAADIPEAMPSLTPPALEHVEISRNWDDIEAPPRPESEAPILAAVGPIQSTAWRVNQFMLDTLGELAKVQSLDMDENAHAAGIGALEQSRKLAEAPRFWYPCRLDWRGRIYQTGGKLQYTSGCDAARALLEFADGSPLTPDGFGWLSVYVATCYGLKGSYKDRRTWAAAHTPDILGAAADPLGSTFWRAAKQPYRFLAACEAWRHAAAGAPVHLPTAADATASMLQHYSGLTGDTLLGVKVNLLAEGYHPEFAPEDTDAPRDFYAEASTAGLTRDEMKAGAWIFYGQTAGTLAVKLGTAEARRLMRSSDQFRTLAAQVGKRRAAALLEATDRFTRHAREAGHDEAKRIRDAWAVAAPAAMDKYKRLRAHARQEAREGRPLEWRLPDGFRVRQANRMKDSTEVTLWLGGHAGPWSLRHRVQTLTEAIDARGQADGYPPNFVHSHDAALLREMVRIGAAHGIARWGVAHDSVAVHANDGGAMREYAAAAVRWLYGEKGGVAASIYTFC